MPISFSYTFHRFFDSLLRDGAGTTFQKVFYRIKHGNLLVKEKYYQGTNRHPDLVYELWRKENGLRDSDLDRMKASLKHFTYLPVISIVIPVYNPAPSHLKRAIESIAQQVYPHWQICICDDGSSNKESHRILEEYVKQNSKIVCLFEPKNAGIVSASQKASELTAGEFIAFMDQDDILSKDALFRVAEKLNEDKNLDLIYSDNDKIDPKENHREVYFKPDYSPDEFLCHNYIGHLSVLRKKIFDEIGGFLPGFDGAQDFEILLRAVRKTDKIAHLPYVLYSWRMTPGSTASSPQAKQYAYDSGRKALEAHFKRQKKDVTIVETNEPGLYRCKLTPKTSPCISIITPSRGGAGLIQCISSVVSKSTYPNYEWIILDQKIEDRKSKEMIQKNRCRIIDSHNENNLSRLFNEGARQARGPHLLFLDDHYEVMTPDWMEALLESFQRDRVGAVGAKLLDSNGNIEHGGMIIGLNGWLGSAFDGVPNDAILYNQTHHLIRNCSAVRSSCLFTSKEIFDRHEGFDERFRSGYGDMDFCFRIRKKNHWIVYTPFSVLRRTEPHPNPDQTAEKILLQEKWKEILSQPDPFYNVNLTRKYSDFSPDAG